MRFRCTPIAMELMHAKGEPLDFVAYGLQETDRLTAASARVIDGS
jgi:hypothetical protein